MQSQLEHAMGLVDGYIKQLMSGESGKGELMNRFIYDGYKTQKHLFEHVGDPGIQFNGMPSGIALNEIKKAFGMYHGKTDNEQLRKHATDLLTALQTPLNFADQKSVVVYKDGIHRIAGSSNIDRYLQERSFRLIQSLDMYIEWLGQAAIAPPEEKREQETLPLSSSLAPVARGISSNLVEFAGELDGIVNGLEVPPATTFQWFYLGYWKGLLTGSMGGSVAEPAVLAQRRQGNKVQLKITGVPEAQVQSEMKASTARSPKSRAFPLQKSLVYIGGPDSAKKSRLASEMAKRYGYVVLSLADQWFRLQELYPEWSKAKLAVEADEELVKAARDRLKKGEAIIVLGHDPSTYYSIDPSDSLIPRTAKRALVSNFGGSSAPRPRQGLLPTFDQRLWWVYFDPKDGELARSNSAFELIHE